MERLTGKELQELHKAGISKGLEHVFVYRFPDSDKMPVMDSDELLHDLEKEKERERQLALYAHIPFCTRICGYCHYFKELKGDEKSVEGLLEGIQKEILSYRQVLGKVKVESVLFGGGTPTSLKAGQLNGLMSFLKERFPMEKRTEATVESSPETLDLEKLEALRQGFNRISIGVQDFDDSVLKKCNRNHSKKEAVKAVEMARQAGFGNVNIDLIYGLPGQGLKGWKKSLEEIEKLQPESVTASDLRVHKGTAFFGMPREEFASEEELVEMHSVFIEKMLALGYEQIFPYQFVKKGRGMKFLEQQWSNREFLGFGPSSCSYLSKWDYNNRFPSKNYLEQVGKKGIGCAVGKKLGRGEQMVRSVALGLKNCKGINKKDFEKEFGQGFDEVFGEKVRELEKLGLVESNEKAIKLSSKGILFYDSVSRKFFA